MAPYKRKRTYRRSSSYRPYRRSYYRRSTIPRRRISGRGDYKTWWGNVKKRWFKPYTGKLAGVGSAIGGAAGNVIAPGIGGTVGGGLGALGGMAVDRIMGWGDYVIKKNTIAIPTQAGEVPVFGKGSIRVTHKEYIASIASSTDFYNSAIELNPGLPQSFPWLSSIAENYEQYRFNGLVFQFVSTSADALNSTNTALGKVMMATDYNAADGNFQSFQQMMGSEFSNMGKPSESLMHAVECDPGEQPNKMYWVRTGPKPDETDIRLYDHGIFQIATQGSQAVATIGDIWVTYDVTFWKPVLNTPLGLTIPTNHWDLTGVTNAAPFGTSFEPENGSNINGLRIDGTTIHFPTNDSIGRYLIIHTVRGTSGPILDEPTWLLDNCEASGIFAAATSFRAGNEGSADDQWVQLSCFKITNTEATAQATAVTFPTTPTGGDLIIQKIPNDLV